MRAYVAMSGAVFGLLFAAQGVHAAHDPEHLSEPAFLFHLIGSLALFLWSVRLLIRRRSSSAG